MKTSIKKGRLDYVNQKGCIRILTSSVIKKKEKSKHRRGNDVSILGRCVHRIKPPLPPPTLLATLYGWSRTIVRQKLVCSPRCKGKLMTFANQAPPFISLP